MAQNGKILKLIEKGVYIPCPETLLIGEDVEPDRISGDGVELYPGTRIFGKNTLISPGSRIGYEAPVTLENVYAGPDTILNGGFFQDAVFVGKNVIGSGAHVRGGTILEEQASAAHTVGLKQTILFPFVTLGSLINFCDCLMAGGTSRKDHSEVGSSFVHFNYTPSQDKATPSMFGNVHQGVMLNNKPVFLGGQGGVVGPCRITFGCVTAAGTICRKDVERPDRLIFGGAMKEGSITGTRGFYTGINRIFKNNCLYISGLIALYRWYVAIRSLFVSDFFSEALFNGMKAVLRISIDERIKRLERFCENLPSSLDMLFLKSDGKRNPLISVHENLIRAWPEVKNVILSFRDDAVLDKQRLGRVPEEFMKAVEKEIQRQGLTYTKVIKHLSPAVSEKGSAWLESIEGEINREILNVLES